MARFVGVRHGRIAVVSDASFDHDEMDVMEISDDLGSIHSSDLITNCQVKNGAVKCRAVKKPLSELKVAFVSNWKMRCGIATYAEHLYPEITKHLNHFKLFIERNDLPTGNVMRMGDRIMSEDRVVVCWKRGESLRKLVEELHAYDPDIILVNHEFGIFPNASYWLSMMGRLSDYRTITTMHSVFHHKDKTIVEAAMSEIIVHQEGGKQVLAEEKGLSSTIHIVPHGCYAYRDDRLWNFYHSDKTIVQFGFLFRYKGWQLALEAVALLKEKHPDVFFTGLCSESPYAKLEHQVYYNELMELASKLGILENISLLRGYRSDRVLSSFLRTNKVALFPYVSSPEHEVWGASGAARLAMAAGMPVITSSCNHFLDLPTIKAETAEQMAIELDGLFSDPTLAAEQIAKQKAYVLENTWEKVAQKYLDIFAG